VKTGEIIMAKVLTLTSSVVCGHPGGKVTMTSVTKLQVNGSPVLLEDGIVLKGVTGCGTPPASDISGPTAKPCLTVSAITAGRATKLKVNGRPVMLETLKGSTDGMVGKATPQNLLGAVANQPKLDTI
jgi:hypothetical protein